MHLISSHELHNGQSIAAYRLNDTHRMVRLGDTYYQLWELEELMTILDYAREAIEADTETEWGAP